MKVSVIAVAFLVFLAFSDVAADTAAEAKKADDKSSNPDILRVLQRLLADGSDEKSFSDVDDGGDEKSLDDGGDDEKATSDEAWGDDELSGLEKLKYFLSDAAENDEELSDEDGSDTWLSSEFEDSDGDEFEDGEEDEGEMSDPPSRRVCRPGCTRRISYANKRCSSPSYARNPRSIRTCGLLKSMEYKRYRGMSLRIITRYISIRKFRAKCYRKGGYRLCRNKRCFQVRGCYGIFRLTYRRTVCRLCPRRY